MCTELIAFGKKNQDVFVRWCNKTIKNMNPVPYIIPKK